MYQIVERNTDLADVGGYPYATAEKARDAAIKRLGAAAFLDIKFATIKAGKESLGTFPVVRSKSGNVDLYIVHHEKSGAVAAALCSRAFPRNIVTFSDPPLSLQLTL
jgi:hypothetical protein